MRVINSLRPDLEELELEDVIAVTKTLIILDTRYLMPDRDDHDDKMKFKEERHYRQCHRHANDAFSY